MIERLVNLERNTISSQALKYRKPTINQRLNDDQWGNEVGGSSWKNIWSICSRQNEKCYRVTRKEEKKRRRSRRRKDRPTSQGEIKRTDRMVNREETERGEGKGRVEISKGNPCTHHITVISEQKKRQCQNWVRGGGKSTPVIAENSDQRSKMGGDERRW